MSFITQHYEKNILATILMGFIAAFVYLIIVLSKDIETTPEDLILPPKEPDYPAKFDKFGTETSKVKKYGELEKLSKKQIWTNVMNADYEGPVRTGLMSPIPAARCPNKECRKIVPYIYFENKSKCLFCNHQFSGPPPPSPPTDDKDGDDMPDTWEKRYGLNPLSPADKWTDLDKDGYPNYLEYDDDPKIMTKPNDAKSHPPLAWRLQFMDSKRKLIPLKLINVMKNNVEQKDKWLVHVKLRDHKKRWREKFVKIGDELRIGTAMYKILDIIYLEKEDWIQALNRPMKINISKIVIKNTVIKDDKPITVELKKPVYENTVRIAFKDSFSKKRYFVNVGNTFTVGDQTVGKEHYKVISFEDKKSAVLQKVDEEKDGEFTINKQSTLEQKIEGENKEKELNHPM